MGQGLGLGESLEKAYEDAVRGAQQAQETIVALHRQLDEARQRASARAYEVYDLTKEVEGLRRQVTNLEDELYGVRVMLQNARDMRAYAERKLAEARAQDGDL